MNLNFGEINMKKQLENGLRRFFLYEVLIAGVILAIGFFTPPLQVPNSWLDSMPNVALINIVGMTGNFLEFLVRFMVWLVYAWMFRQLVVKNSFSLNGHLHEQVSEPNSTDSPAWLLFGGYVALGIILGIKVAFNSFWGFLLFAPLRVLFGSILGYVISQRLIARETTVRSAEDFCTQIGLSHAHGTAILTITGMLLGAIFA
jgi:hypothetical protein